MYYYLIAEEILITFYSTDDRHSGEHTTAKVTQNRCRLRELSRSKKVFSLIPKNSSPRRPLPVLDSTKRSVSVSTSPRGPSVPKKGASLAKRNLTYEIRLQDSPERHRGSLRRQEVPLHLRCQHPRQNLQVSDFFDVFVCLAVTCRNFYCYLLIINSGRPPN